MTKASQTKKVFFAIWCLVAAMTGVVEQAAARPPQIRIEQQS